MKQRSATHMFMVIGTLVLLTAPGAAGGESPDNAGAFEFAQKPSVSRQGAAYTIAFAVRKFCDATVAVENKDGKIIRHLASGVLGAHAPEPFQNNSLSQSIAWDGKNDSGEYPGENERPQVRVSLGLRPQFERTLYWSPKKRTPDPNYLDYQLVMAPAPEGVYVYDGGTGDHVRLFDHDGNYVRTIFPFPSNRLKDAKGLVLRKYPQDGQTLPLKWGQTQSSLLTAGSMDAGGAAWPSAGGLTPATVLAIKGTQLVVAQQRINHLSTDGSTGGEDFQGPTVFVPTSVPAIHEWRGGVVNVPPTDAVFSADGKWIYLTGYMWTRSWMKGCLNGVARCAASGEGKLENFIGNLSEVSGNGTVEKSFVEKLGGIAPVGGQLQEAASVDVDSKGRVYVADYLGNRIRVYDADAKHLKDIPVDEPALVRVDPKNGEMYVFRHSIPAVRKNVHDDYKATLTHLGPFEDPKVRSTYPINTASWDWDRPAIRYAVDFYTSPPTIWMSDNARTSYGWQNDRPEKCCARLLVERDGKLVVKRDFGAELRQEFGWLRGVRHGKQRLYLNPKSGKLYVGELHMPWAFHVTSMLDIPVVDPVSGAITTTKLPFDAEDMAFDLNGLAYLRTSDAVARFDPETWREVPFDYGEEVDAMTALNLPHATAPVMSAIRFNGGFESSSQLGGITVSAKGHIVVTACTGQRAADGHIAIKGDVADEESRNPEGQRLPGSAKTYMPQVYPGRAMPMVVHVFDKHGKMVYEDAAPGIGRMNFVAMDKDDMLYAAISGVGHFGSEWYDNPGSCTLLKMKPKTRILGTQGVIPLTADIRPQRPPDVHNADFAGDLWAEEAAWVRGGVSLDTKRQHCHCGGQSEWALDYFARSFVPEVDHYSVLVVDSNNNEILRIGHYGNVDDGAPLIKDGGPPHPHSIGGDEVAILHAQMLAVHSDRRLFISDLGNARILSVKLGYHCEERVALSADQK